tara:strand:+ start:97 stop:450 length:354 start_codon:yes stop_codon:yes gene_type:complete
MEEFLAFSIGVITCIILAGVIYSVITIKKIKDASEILEDDFRDIQERITMLDRRVDKLADNIGNQIDEIKTDMGSTYDGLIDEVDDMIEEVYEEAAIQLEKRFEQIETFLKKNVKQQ